MIRDSNLKIKPFLKWAGGKFRLLERILPLLPPGKCLIEPYVGSGAVFLNSHYNRYILNDVNPDLINLYTIVQSRPAHYIAQAKSFFHSKYNTEKQYYALRERFNQSQDPEERSALFLYLNRHGYNGLCRYNKKGLFNVPFGRYQKPYFPAEEIMAFAEKAKRVRFVCQDFQEVMKKATVGSVIYCDPPYVPLSHTAYFTQYCQTDFGTREQTRLADLAKHLRTRGITTIISNHDTQFTRELYREASISHFEHSRVISCNANKRQKARELIARFAG
ncbi:MAG: adenine methylase [Gammaproteobacteria bacterium]|jgi:DNA adenine methylase|nr:adenine methylase [Gammaproteobacteria bacterium]